MKKIYLYSCFILVVLLLCFGILLYCKIIKINVPSEEKYPIRGVDVSGYQGLIDWDTLGGQGIDFAFIKATEGSSFVDEHFLYNYTHATDTELKVGAYHFFSYDSSGLAQAEHFIATVKKLPNTLPPAVDVEFYGDKEKELPNKDSVRENLQILLDRLEAHYEVKPIIYATNKSYRLYISENFPEYDIWIRDVYFVPQLADKRPWRFWQYSDRGLLKGYEGVEKYIDLNVFCGTKKDFEQYTS